MRYPNYFTADYRCAVDLSSFNLGISERDAVGILEAKGFSLIDVDIVDLASRCIGTSRYRRGARKYEAPIVVDCSSLTKWLYSQLGIWLPRRTIQQRALGEIIQPEKILPGDLVFITGAINYYDNILDGVGHVGIATGNETVIHAANQSFGVVETPLSRFTEGTKFRGARRYIPNEKRILTFQVPETRDVECSDDLRWIILQSL